MGNKTIITALAGIALMGTTSVASAQTATANFSQGDTVSVAAAVNVRGGPNGAVLGQKAAGATGTLVGGPVNANGYTWWQVDYTSGTDGWTAEDFLQNTNTARVPSQGATAVAPAPSAPASSSTVSDLYAKLNALLAQIKALSQAAGAAGSQ